MAQQGFATVRSTAPVIKRLSIINGYALVSLGLYLIFIIFSILLSYFNFIYFIITFKFCYKD